MIRGDRIARQGLEPVGIPATTGPPSPRLPPPWSGSFCSPPGGRPGGVVPTLKVATNTPLAEHKLHWIDFGAAPSPRARSISPGLLPGFIDTVLAVASGRPTRNEENAIHDLVIFKKGITL